MNNNSLVHECFGNHDSLKKYLYILKYEQNNDTLDGIDIKYLMPPIYPQSFYIYEADNETHLDLGYHPISI